MIIIDYCIEYEDISQRRKLTNVFGNYNCQVFTTVNSLTKYIYSKIMIDNPCSVCPFYDINVD